MFQILPPSTLHPEHCNSATGFVLLFLHWVQSPQGQERWGRTRGPSPFWPHQHWHSTSHPISQLRKPSLRESRPFYAHTKRWGASLGIEARSQNEGNSRLLGKGRILNFSMEARVSMCVSSSSSAWVTVSPGHVYCCPQTSVAIMMREGTAPGA